MSPKMVPWDPPSHPSQCLDESKTVVLDPHNVVICHTNPRNTHTMRRSWHKRLGWREKLLTIGHVAQPSRVRNAKHQPSVRIPPRVLITFAVCLYVTSCQPCQSVNLVVHTYNAHPACPAHLLASAPCRSVPWALTRTCLRACARVHACAPALILP